jgi:hypothetical protein
MDLPTELSSQTKKITCNNSISKLISNYGILQAKLVRQIVTFIYMLPTK